MPRVTEAQIEAARFQVFRSAGSFNGAVQDFVDSVGHVYTVPLHKKLHLQGLRSIVLKTPVDTGRARGNWQSTTETPAGGTLASTDPSGRRVIGEGVDAVRGLAPYTVSYITNNLDYIEGLEAGASDQFEGGHMVARTLAELEAQFGE